MKQPNSASEKFLHLQIVIRDSGIGISQQDFSNLFMDFGKLDDKEGRNNCGTGLGLSICKQIIEQMGGTVSVRSKVGTGTEFIIDMKVQGKSGRVVLPAEMEQVHIGLMEPNEAESKPRPFLKFLEASPGKPLKTAWSSDEKMEMKGVNKSSSYRSSSIVVASCHKIERLIQKNFIPASSKPNTENMPLLFEEAKVPEEEAKQQEPVNQHAQPPKLRVLIANDELFQLSILEALFGKSGFDVTTAINGQEAYEHCLRKFANGNSGFDLVVLDLCMPVSDGFNACR